ncbi:MAG TPA: hypothetical protein VFW96_10690 [Thermomicrobiales bacterium]|nr:hypothetical protein [Thermomicrobiales bacterium]
MVDASDVSAVVATFCERAIEDREGIFTLVRLYDQLTVRVAADFPGPTPQEPLPVNITFFVALKARREQPWPDLIVRIVNPDDGAHDVPVTGVDPAEPKDGMNLVLGLTLTVTREGRYWFEVIYEGRSLTRAPLRIAIQRLPRSELLLDARPMT